MKIKQKIRFAFYVSGGASRLLKLLEKKSKIINSTFLIVNDNGPNNKLNKLSVKNKIHYIELNYVALGLIANERNKYISKLLFEKFNKFNIDYCFCFGRKILSGDLLIKYKYKIINFHPSILPMFPGEKSIDQALINRAFLLGNTAHFIDDGVDTGPIIMQSISYKNVSCDQILDLQIPMIEQIFNWIIEDRLIIINNNVTIKKANYKPKIFFPCLEQK